MLGKPPVLVISAAEMTTFPIFCTFASTFPAKHAIKYTREATILATLSSLNKQDGLGSKENCPTY